MTLARMINNVLHSGMTAQGPPAPVNEVQKGSLQRTGNVSASNLPNGKIRFLLYASSRAPDSRATKI